MFSIASDLKEFTKALLLGKPLCVNQKGHWWIESLWRKTMRQLFGYETARIVHIAKAFNAILESLEAIPIYFKKNSSLPVEQKVNFHDYLRAGEVVLAQLSSQESSSAIQARSQLQLLLLSLKYRLEAANGGLNPQAPRQDLQSLILEQADFWKSTLEIATGKSVAAEEDLAVEEISRFPEIVKILLADRQEAAGFFNWVLRDQLPAVLYVAYPGLCKKLTASKLNGRIGRMGHNKILKIVKRPVNKELAEKVVTLPFEGVDLSILDESKIIQFRGNYRLSLAEIYEIFRNKHLRVGNLEFMAQGISNWNVQKWGWWNAELQTYEVANLQKNGWWRELPLFETVPLQVAKARYGAQADGIGWMAAATATRGRASLDVDLTHAYLEVAIPMGAGSYGIFDFGKLANEFPGSLLETLQMVCHTVHATIAYPDENVYYTHRQHAQHVFKLSPEQGIKLMRSIEADMLHARQLNFVYQVESENCAKWVHEKLEIALGFHAIPNLFVTSIFHTEPLSFLKTIISFCKILPKGWQIKALTFFHLPLGAANGHWIKEHGKPVWRALTHHPFWETGIIYLPCFLHKQKELGHLEKEHAFTVLSEQISKATSPIVLLHSLHSHFQESYALWESKKLKETRLGQLLSYSKILGIPWSWRISIAASPERQSLWHRNCC